MNRLLQDHATAIGWITSVSLVMLVGSAVVVPWIVVRIPSDFFASDRRPPSRFANRHPALRWTLRILRNVFGSVLLLAGLAMLILPGQGLLTLAMAVVMLDFPRKHKFERWIIRMPPVLKSINWLRRRANVAPLRVKRDPNRKSRQAQSTVRDT